MGKDISMMIFTSDWHLGHANISQFAGRPFPHGPAGVQQMNAEILRRYNCIAGPDDIAYFLGDMFMGKIGETLPLGRKATARVRMLIAGNHDRCWDGAGSKSGAWKSRYKKEGGFSVIYTGADNEAVPGVNIGGTTLLMRHFPYKGGGDSREAERYSEYRLADQGHWLLCGHVHEKWRQRGRMINVGIDAWGGFPVTEDQIAEVVSEGPADREPLPW